MGRRASAESGLREAPLLPGLAPPSEDGGDRGVAQSGAAASGGSTGVEAPGAGSYRLPSGGGPAPGKGAEAGSPRQVDPDGDAPTGPGPATRSGPDAAPGGRVPPAAGRTEARRQDPDPTGADSGSDAPAPDRAAAGQGPHAGSAPQTPPSDPHIRPRPGAGAEVAAGSPPDPSVGAVVSGGRADGAGPGQAAGPGQDKAAADRAPRLGSPSATARDDSLPPGAAGSDETPCRMRQPDTEIKPGPDAAPPTARPAEDASLDEAIAAAIRSVRQMSEVDPARRGAPTPASSRPTSPPASGAAPPSPDLTDPVPETGPLAPRPITADPLDVPDRPEAPDMSAEAKPSVGAPRPEPAGDAPGPVTDERARPAEPQTDPLSGSEKAQAPAARSPASPKTPPAADPAPSQALALNPAEPKPRSKRRKSKASPTAELPNQLPDHAEHRRRLRQRFMQGGAEAMPDYELLELVLFRAIPRRDVKPLAKRLMRAFGGFDEVISAPPPRLTEVEGVGEAVVHELKIVEAAAQRLARARVMGRDALQSWDQLVDYCRTRIAREPVEQFRILYLDRKNLLIADEAQGRGTVDHVPVYPREVVRRALELQASALILTHNHPSGDPTPSHADIEMTRRILAACAAVGLTVHDHVIVGRDQVVSFHDLGLLDD